jgi:hypothetical protein
MSHDIIRFVATDQGAFMHLGTSDENKKTTMADSD